MAEDRSKHQSTARPSLVLRLVVSGLFLYVLVWWGLDRLHSSQLSIQIKSQLSERLAQKSARDAFRFDMLLQSHHSLAVLLAESLPNRIPLDAGTVTPDFDPGRLLPLAGTRNFPPLDLVLAVSAKGEVSRIWGRGNSLGAWRAPTDTSFPASEPQARVFGDGDVLTLVSMAEIPRSGGFRLVAISRLDSDFIRATMGSYLDRGFAVILADEANGRVLVSSNPILAPGGAAVAALASDFIIGPPHMLDMNGGTERSVALRSLLAQSEYRAALSEPIIGIERLHRSILTGVSLFFLLGGAFYLGWRVRRMRRRVLAMGGRIFGLADARERFRWGGRDEIDDLEDAVSQLVDEVLQSREALAREEGQRTRLLTERLSLEGENERLQMLQAVTDEMGVGVIRIGPDGPIAENAAMLRFAERSEGLTPFVQARTRGESLLQTGPDQHIYEVRLARQIDAGLILVRDVTEEGRAREALEAFAQFPNQNPHPVLRVDAGGVVTHANPASAGLLANWKVSVGEVLPGPWRQVFREVLDTGLRRDMEVTVNERVMSLFLVPLKEFRVVNLYGADITGRVAAERLLHLVNENLERRIQARTEALTEEVEEHVRAKRELVAAVDRAEVANRAKTELLANVSHELRTPLNAIIGFSEIMMAEMFGPLGTERYQSYVRDIANSGRHLLEVINDILDVAMVESGRTDFHPVAVDLAEVTQAAVRLLDVRAESGGITLDSRLIDPLETIMADRRRVLQILVNLVSNAIKFTPKGGRVELEVASDADGARFTVRDTGIGMSDDEVVVALQPFRQVDGGLSRRYGGTGLGLALVRAYVELHHGVLSIDSRKGHGTTVTVSLPKGDDGDGLDVRRTG